MEQEIIFRKSICLGYSRFQIGKKNIYLDTGEPGMLIGEYLKNWIWLAHCFYHAAITSVAKFSGAIYLRCQWLATELD